MIKKKRVDRDRKQRMKDNGNERAQEWSKRVKEHQPLMYVRKGRQRGRGIREDVDP